MPARRLSDSGSGLRRPQLAGGQLRRLGPDLDRLQRLRGTADPGPVAPTVALTLTLTGEAATPCAVASLPPDLLLMHAADTGNAPAAVSRWQCRCPPGGHPTLATRKVTRVLVRDRQRWQGLHDFGVDRSADAGMGLTPVGLLNKQRMVLAVGQAR